MTALIIAYALNVIDYLFTAYWVRRYGIDIEGNPLGRWMLENNAAWWIKIFAVGGLFAALGYLIRRYPRLAPAAYLPLCVYAVVVVYHVVLAVYIKLQGG